MERVGEILASMRPCRAYLARGPYDGAAIPIPGHRPWPPYLCLGADGATERYVHEESMPGAYVWAGSCAVHDCLADDVTCSVEALGRTGSPIGGNRREPVA